MLTDTHLFTNIVSYILKKMSFPPIQSFVVQCSKLNLVTDASKNGVAQETIQNTIRRGTKVMTEQEARQVLGVTEETPWEEIVKVGLSPFHLLLFCFYFYFYF